MVTGTHNLWRLNIDEYCHYGFIVWRHPSVESMSQKALKGYRDHNYKTTTNLATFLTCQVRQGLTPRVEIASDEERKRDGFQSMKLRWGNAKRHRTPSHRNLTQNCLDHILVQTFLVILIQYCSIFSRLGRLNCASSPRGPSAMLLAMVFGTAAYGSYESSRKMVHCVYPQGHSKDILHYLA